MSSTPTSEAPAMRYNEWADGGSETDEVAVSAVVAETGATIADATLAGAVDALEVEVSPQPQPAAEPVRRREVIAVGGGKGGIGKSLLAANLGIHLAQMGKQVILIDADLGGANLHTCLGIKAPPVTLSDFVNRRVKDLEQVITPTPVKGLGLVSGALDLLGAANPKYTQKLRLLREVTKLDVDCVVIDLGGGTGFNILDFFLIADHGVLTAMPEPTSIENAYRFIKAAYYRRLKTAEMSFNLRPLVEEAMAERSNQGLRTPADLVAFVTRRNAEAGARLKTELEAFPLKLVLNQVRSPEEHKLGVAIADACRKYFGIPMQFLGSIPYDDAVWQSVRKRRPVLLEQPEAAASRSIRAIAKTLGLLDDRSGSATAR